MRELSRAGAGTTGTGDASDACTQQEALPQPQGVAFLQSWRTGDAKAVRCESTRARLNKMVTMAFTRGYCSGFDAGVKGKFKQSCQNVLRNSVFRKERRAITERCQPLAGG